MKQTEMMPWPQTTQQQLKWNRMKERTNNLRPQKKADYAENQ